jgi:hypothetical protein
VQETQKKQGKMRRQDENTVHQCAKEAQCKGGTIGLQRYGSRAILWHGVDGTPCKSWWKRLSPGVASKLIKQSQTTMKRENSGKMEDTGLAQHHVL